MDLSFLFDAIRLHNVANLKLGIASNIDVNYRDISGWTALHYACYHAFEEGVVQLIAAGANIDAPDNFGCTPLHYTCHYMFTKGLTLLIGAGANVNAQNNFGWTPLHRACYYIFEQGVIALIAAGADARIKNNNGRIARNLIGDHPEIIEILDGLGGGVSTKAAIS